MAHVAHQARLDQPNEAGERARPYLEARAERVARARGLDSLEYAEARAALDGPGPPEAIRYLLEWSDDLYGRSGVGMNGLAPLTWESLDAWARRKNVDVLPHECDALMALDSLRRHPPVESAPAETPRPAPPWPEKSHG